MSLTSDDLVKKLSEALQTGEQRNEAVQASKEKGGAHWVVALITALLALAGIGVAMYLANRRAKELAEAKTKLEQQRVELDQRKHDAKKVEWQKEREALLEGIKSDKVLIDVHEDTLKKAEEEFEAQKKRLENLRAWEEINEA